MAQLFVVPPAANIALIYAGPAIGLWRGGWRVRLISAAYICQYLGDELLPNDYRPGHHPLIGVRLLLEDAVLIALCLVCLRRATRYWIVWTTAVLIISTVIDVMFSLGGLISARTFVSSSRVWTYLLGLILIWGAFTDGRKARAAPEATADGQVHPTPTGR